MADQSADALKLVALGDFDIDPDGLRDRGSPWAEVLPGDAGSHVSVDTVAQLPTTGWREISTARSASADGARLFAAPSGAGWALAYLSPNGVLSADPGPLSLRPGRATRRQGLLLEWTSDTILRSDLASITVRLRNTSSTRWVADEDDHDYVHGWFLTDGRRLGPDRFAHASRPGSLPDLDVGKSLDLAVDFGRTTPIPAPGNYAVQAAMTSFDLWTGPHSIRLI